MKSFFVLALVSLAVASPTLTTRDETADSVEARAPQESDAIICLAHGSSYSACINDPSCYSCDQDSFNQVYCCPAPVSS